MDKTSDTYKTISKPSEEILFKEKKSKFFGYAFPIQSDKDVQLFIVEIKKKHHTAGHVCYAWQLGVETIRYRANDDGEPNNSAGLPIYGQIQAFELTNVLVAVARIFGGTKLGVGGLISAYRTSAKLTLENADVIEKIMQQQFQLSFDYSEMDKVMRIIKQHQCKIISQQMEASCKMIIAVRKNDFDQLNEILIGMHKVTFRKINN